ncbi:MAG: hypothetical protein KC800_08380 [Candidatus Eremiobacteraeota bacterium]|nr:hypothetical protein [Candidatus Eremiobacteraeota bacterium]
MTELDPIIKRCLNREADSFTELVEATYDEAVLRLGQARGKLLPIYRLIHRHIDQMKRSRDFWPWFQNLAVSVTEEEAQAQKSDILRVCGSVPEARTHYSLGERLASLALGGWFFGPPIIAITWATQQRGQLKLPEGPSWSAFVAVGFLVGLASWLLLNFLFRPVIDGRRARILNSKSVWLLAPGAATGLVLLYSVFLHPAVQRSLLFSEWVSFENDSWKWVLVPQEKDILLTDQLLASIADWWILALVPTSWLLVVISKKLHKLAPWVWKRRPGWAYYFFSGPLWAVVLLLCVPSFRLLVPVEYPRQLKELAERRDVAFDATVTRQLENLRNSWKSSDGPHSDCRSNRDLMASLLATEGWQKADPLELYQLGFYPDPETECPFRHEARVQNVLISARAGGSLWHIWNQTSALAEEPLKGDVDWKQLSGLMEAADWPDSPAPDWQRSLTGPHEYFQEVMANTKFPHYDFPVEKANFLWHEPYLSHNFINDRAVEFWEFEQRVKETTLRDGALGAEELKLLNSGTTLSPYSPSRDRYEAEVSRRCLAILELVLFLKQKALEGGPIPISLEKLPLEMKNRLEPYLSFITYEKLSNDEVLIVQDIPEAGGVLHRDVRVNLSRQPLLP